MYAQVVSIIIFTSLAMFVATFLKSPKGYMSFAISYLILQVIFGSLVLFPFNSIREVDTLTGTLLPQLDNSDYFDPAFKATSGIFIYVRPSGNEFDFTNFVF
jgi:ABC-type transport system involved in multi-copper enzyme maturation permease subunit